MESTTELRRTPASIVSSRRRSLTGGGEGNARLTSLTGVSLLVLLAVEGATIPFLGSLLSVHIFLGMLLLAPVGLKLAVTGYRFARYYAHGREYVHRGPPAPLMRLIVAPVLVLSTLTLFGSGVVLIASPARGLVLGLHKASFIVWFGAMGIHVLAYTPRAVRHVLSERARRRVGGAGIRLVLLVAALAGGVAIAVLTFPLAAPWLHGALHWRGN